MLAALFSISLILLPLDYGVTGPGHNNILYLLGDMLYSVYGFCSILIPGFLLVAGLSCFASKWTARKTLRLLTALVPFFTCVVTESIVRSIIKVDHSSFAIVKILIALVTGAMLVIIEFLGTGIIADRLRKPKMRAAVLPEVEKTSESLDEAPVDGESSESEALPEFNKLSKIKVPKESIFDKLKNKFKKSEDEDSDDYSDDDYEDDDTEKKATIFDEILDEVDTYEAEPEETAVEEDVYALAQKPEAPSLTNEEFAALTAPQEELEWNNLPPKPENLPPEYDADFDENDPALEFPPKDADEGQTEKTETVAENAVSNEAAPETEAKDEAKDETVEDVVYEPKNDPYATTRYIDSVVENPLYPHKIVLDDGSEETAEKKTPDQPVTEKPKYPTRIQIKDDAVFESKPEPEAAGDDYVEDETLPFPAFDLEEPAINTKPSILTKQEKAETTENENYRSVGSYFNNEDSPKIATKENLYNYFENVDAKKTAPKIEDPYEAESAASSDSEEDFEDNPQIFDQLAQQQEQADDDAEESEVNISTAAASVFKDMDADIRKTMPAKDPAAPAAANSGSHGPAHGGATNLTKDELSDFFNAQQEENTPKTKEIAANPPKTNRATKKGPYVIPSDLLTAYKDDQYWIIDDATKQASLNLKQTLSEFNIEADIIGIKKGPVVTMFEILPAPGVKLSKIVALQDNIALSLAAQSVRIVAPIPGKQAVGIEVPNRNRSVVGFREIIEMDLPEWKKMAVPVVLGKDILGKAQLIDLVKTPHMLIAGATGSGKSVCVNSLILSILYKRSFEDVKMILVDPKVVELKLYNNIPHLLTPVITEPKKALQALQWCLCEMERRYALLDGMGVRDISNYNKKIKEQKICTEKLPYIVVIIDEFADLMATSGDRKSVV